MNRAVACLCPLVVSAALAGQVLAADRYVVVSRDSIAVGSYAGAAPRLRFRTLLENRELEGWLLAASESCLVISVKDQGLGASTPMTTGTPGVPDPVKYRQGGHLVSPFLDGALIWIGDTKYRIWNAQGIREISRANIARIEIDRWSTRDFTVKPKKPATKHSGIGGKPRNR